MTLSKAEGRKARVRAPSCAARALWASLATLSLLSGCDLSGNGGGGGAPNEVGEVPPAVSSSMTLDARGGAVAQTSAESPMAGAAVWVPPGAFETATRVALSTQALPSGSSALGVGEVLHLDLRGTVPLRSLSLTVPVPQGIDATLLTVAKWDASALQWVPIDGAQIVPCAPDVSVCGRLRVSVDGEGLYRALYRDLVQVQLTNAGAVTVEVVLAGMLANKGTQQAVFLPSDDEFARSLGALQGASLSLPQGDYVIRAQYEGETAPRCLVFSVPAVERVAAEVSGALPPCELVEVTARISDARVESGASIEASVELAFPEPVDPAALPTVTYSFSASWDATVTGGGDVVVKDGVLEPVMATIPAPIQPGQYQIQWTLRRDGEIAGHAAAALEVSGPNHRPALESIALEPRTVRLGSEARDIAFDGASGVTRMTVLASDEDADLFNVFWEYPAVGNLYEVPSGALLVRDSETGLAVSVADSSFYEQPSVLYMAPPPSFLSSIEDGVWPSLAAVISDGIEVRYVHRLVGVVAEVGTDPGPDQDSGVMMDSGAQDAGTTSVVASCLVRDQSCTNYIGPVFVSNAATVRNTCMSNGGTYREKVACPSLEAVGACTTYQGAINEQQVVHYSATPDPAQTESLRMACDDIPVGAGGPARWEDPYVPPQ